MKYDIDKELKYFSLFSGSMVGRLYPLINTGYRLKKCKSDSLVTVKEYSTPGYQGDNIPWLLNQNSIVEICLASCFTMEAAS